MTNEQEELICESMRERILSLIAVCGELPADQLKRIPGGDEYKQNIIKQLKKRKQIKTFYKDGLRGYRLFLSTKEMLLEQNSERFSFYLSGVSETNHIRSEVTRRLRLHRLAETTVTMLNGGVEIYRDCKSIGSPIANDRLAVGECCISYMRGLVEGIETKKIFE